MKGGLACAVAAARALRDAGVSLRGRLLVESVVGEEDGGLGTLATLARGHRADAAVVVEPSALSIVTAQAGCPGFRITVPGESAHGALRWEGVSAVELFRPVHDALLALETERTAADLPIEYRPLFADHPIPFPLSIGTVRAGVWASTVPEGLIAEGRYGVIPEEHVTTARSRFEAAVENAAAAHPWLREHPPVVEWSSGQYSSSLTPLGAPIEEVLCSAHADCLGDSPRLAGVTYGADMGLLSTVGRAPTVICGPGDVSLSHRPDEHVPIAELEQAAGVLAVLAMRFCGVAGKAD